MTEGGDPVMETGSPNPLSLDPYVPRLVLGWPGPQDQPSHAEIVGSMVLVDISGFTRMSERLARRGKIGAEEVARVIESCFGSFLADAYAEDGGLIKFGGDALLLFFGGEDHARRASRAAAGMRVALRGMNPIQTAAGSVTLRMHAGIHSGPFLFFLAGERHRELVAAGPAVTRTVKAASAAEAGEIVVTEETARAIDEPAVLGAERAPGFLLRRRPGWRPFERQDQAPPRRPRIDPASCLSAAVRRHLETGGPEAEHRRVTVGFLRFEAIDGLAAGEAPGRVSAVLHSVMTRVQKAAEDHGVTFISTDVDADGVKVILAAGAPSASEGDEEAMLRTARSVADAALPLPCRIGVARGHVFAGDIGPSYRRTYTLIGDTVNLAARFMSASSLGQVLVQPEVVERSSLAFEAEPVEPLRLKGKARPVPAVLVGAPKVRRWTETGAETPLLGREAEMEALRHAVDGARRGRGQLVQVVGEQGIGKSRLVEELRGLAGGAETLAVRCDAFEASIPYSAFRGVLLALLGADGGTPEKEIVRRMHDAVERVAPQLRPWVPLLLVPLEIIVPATAEVDLLDPAFRKPRTEEAVAELLGAILDRPSVLVFEDAHWMDAASSDLLHRLIADLAARPWLACVTRREAGTGFAPRDEDGATTLRPQPLSHADAVELLSSSTGPRALLPHEIDTLARRSGGNPLFLQELMAIAQEGRSLEVLPDSVEASISSRVDRLGPAHRSLLRRASVLGLSFPRSLARDVIPEAGAEAWEALAEFIEPEAPDRLRFKHDLIRDVAYEGLPFRARLQLHQRVGETIEAAGSDLEDNAALLSLHFFHAERHDRAWSYSRTAAGRAAAAYANPQAETLYGRALIAARRLGGVEGADLAEVLEGLGDVRDRMGDYPGADTAYTRARHLIAGQPLGLARLLLKQSHTALRRDRYADAIRWIGRARRVLDGVPGQDAAGQRAQLAVWYAGIRQQQGRGAEAARWCRQAIEEARGAGARGALAHAYYLLDWVSFAMGQPGDGELSREALTIYEELGDLPGQANVLNNLGGFAYYAGRWDLAVDLYERGRAAREKTGDASNAAFGNVNIAEILADQGRLEEAEALLKDALRVWRAAGHRSGIAYAVRLLGRVAARGGRFDRAHELLAEAREIFVGIGAEDDILDTDARAAEASVLAGDGAAAEKRASEALQGARSRPSARVLVPTLLRVLGYAAWQRGAPARAKERLEASLAEAEGQGAEFEAALALNALARLIRFTGGDAVRYEARARQILDRIGVVAVPLVPVVS